MPITVGQPAPDFALKDQSQQEVKLSDFKGKKNVVLVFYPLDWSPTCTNEHVCFVTEKMGIRYPLLADFHPRGAVASKFGAYLEDRGITGRAIAIINKAGNVAWFKQYGIPEVPDVKEVAQALAQVDQERGRGSGARG